MSNEIVNKIRKLPIHSTPKYLLWVIADIADKNGETSWYAPTARLIEETGFSNRTIADCLFHLKECGILVINGCTGRQNRYEVTPENFNPAIKYQPKKRTKPMSEAHQCAKFTSEPRSQPPVNIAPKPVNLAQKPVSEVHTIPLYPLYPSVYPSIGDSENLPDEKPKPSNPKSEKPNKQKRITKKQTGINRLVELGCDEKYAHDWMVARKGAELTDSIIENLIEQANKANVSIATAVQWSARKGYQGFKADWYLKDQQPQQGYQNPKKDINADYWASFAQPAQQQDWSEPIDVTPKKTNWIEGVGHA